ncbi:MAG: DUF5320 domain-containing protein [Bacillota bacterium]|jgi:hypothetical protein
MPGGDGTGPMGMGPLTGRRFGRCVGARGLARGACFGLGLGLGMAGRRGFGRGFRSFAGFAGFGITAEERREMLRAQKERLKSWLEVIDKQLEGETGK